MKEQFVTYEIALKLKELGFDSSCFSAYTENGKLMDIGDYSNDDKVGELDGHSYYISCLSPLWQQVIDWFREKHKIRVCNLVNIYIEATFIIYHSTDVEVIDGNDFYKTREQAILKAIELCKKQ